MTKPKIIFEEGCFDNISEDMTEEDLQELISQIEEMVETGEFFELATAVEELDEEEQEEILQMLQNTNKHTRH